MRLIYWKCKGMGGKGKDGEIRNIVVGKKANLVDLIETKHTLLTEAKV